MDHHEIAKSNTYAKLIAFFQIATYSVIWNAFIRLKTEITKVITLNAQLLVYIMQQGLDIRGKTEAKNVAYISMYTLIVDASKRAHAWAIDNANPDFVKLFSVTMSGFKQLPEIEGYALALNLRNALNTNIIALLDYELTPADITTIDASVTTYETWLGVVGSAKQHKVEGTKGIDIIMKEMDESLVLIDDLLVSRYKNTNPSMVSEYLGDRKIDDLPTHHGGVSVHFVDALSGKNIQGATMTIGTKKATSDISGLAEIIKNKWGIFNVTFECEGYVSQIIEVTIVRGKVTKMDVKMYIKITPVVPPVVPSGT